MDTQAKARRNLSSYSWVRVEPPSSYVDDEDEEHQTAATFSLLQSPGTETYPRQRVIQVCLGSEHGVLVTDFGVPFTFGDNRYGQLGRQPCGLSEKMAPHPVLELLEFEIVQVAAGWRHCLALSSSRYVWSWGRNKVGQLGCGDTRDKMAPIQVIDPKGGGRAAHLQNIICISAGGNSSVAASLFSELLQWGEISTDFKEKKTDGTGTQVAKTSPFVVGRREDFRSHLRREQKSISEAGYSAHGMEKPTRGEQDKLADLLRAARKWRRSIKEARDELRIFSAQKKSQMESIQEVDDTTEAHEIHDTIALLEREIRIMDREIYLLERNLESCEEQQKHLRDQIQGLAGQGARLSARESHLAITIFEGKSNDRNLDKEMAEVKEQIESNHSTRTTLLEQRTEADKEKQRIDFQLKEKRKLKAEQEKRLQRILELKRSFDAAGGSDRLLESTKEVVAQLEELVPKPGPDMKQEPSFSEAMTGLETEEADLVKVEANLRELIRASAAQPARAEWCRQVVHLLQSLVDMHRKKNELMLDKWVRDEADMSSFFYDQKPVLHFGWQKPVEPPSFLSKITPRVGSAR